MAVYVDDEQIPWRGKLWCHLVADTLPELHEFASQLGLRRAWFQSKSLYPHYDVTTSVRDRALALGAKLGDRGTIVYCAKRLKAEQQTEAQLMSQL
jgi:hypothetical protein